jgi:threonylcarbamoyladenosine tRNA methylthiotransferase MtaB
MNRRYTSKEYAAFIEKAIRTVPDLGLGTDIMVGFPGETDTAFANTRGLAADLPFSYFHVFSYSPRHGTTALKLPDAIPAGTITARREELCALSRAKRLAFYHRRVGQTVSVLFEARNQSGLFTGLTDNYIRVGVPAGSDLHNQLRPVRLTGAMDGLALGAAVDSSPLHTIGA